MTWPTQYACAPQLDSTDGVFSLRPISWDDREQIREWRNRQIDVLRQARVLTAEDQDAYYLNVVEPQFSQARPAQVLLAYTCGDDLLGYGGVVHINWPDRRGEVSFLTATDRLDEETFASDWNAYLNLLIPLCRDRLRFHKLTTETYETRTMLVPILESHGFVLEGRLREHHLFGDTWIDSLAHGLLL